MAEQGIHYRQGGKLTHCGCEALPNGQDIEYIVIRNVEYKAAENVGGREEKNIWIAHFEPNTYTNLPMVLNATNRKRLSKLAKTPFINLVKNFPVRLTQEECRDAQDGGNTWGLRISKIPATMPKTPPPPPPPPQKQVLTSENPDWDNCVSFLVNGGLMTKLEVRYSISDEVKKELDKAVKDNGPNAGSGA